jgi:hypothetical protein
VPVLVAQGGGPPQPERLSESISISPLKTQKPLKCLILWVNLQFVNPIIRNTANQQTKKGKR